MSRKGQSKPQKPQKWSSSLQREELKLQEVNARHALILVIGGDMRDLRDLDNAAALLHQDHATSHGDLGCCFLPRYQRMRPLPLPPALLRKECFRRKGAKPNLEIVAIVDRYDTGSKNNGIEVWRIREKGGRLQMEPTANSGAKHARGEEEEDPSPFLRAAVRACLKVEHLAIVFWGHGSGIFGGLLGDAHPDPKRGGAGWLPIWEAAGLLRDGGLGMDSPPKKADLIAVVGCFAGMVETMDAFEPYAKTFAGFANKIDPRFFDFEVFIDEMKDCHSPDCDNEHWARASIKAIKEGYRKYVGTDGEYRFARCAASAWRIEAFKDAIAQQVKILEQAGNSWPTVLYKSVEEAYHYDDMESGDLHDFVAQLKKNGTKHQVLLKACEGYLDALLRYARIDYVVEGFEEERAETLTGLGVWLPRRSGPAFERVARAYERLEKSAFQKVREKWLLLQRRRLEGGEQPVRVSSVTPHEHLLSRIPGEVLDLVLKALDERERGRTTLQIVREGGVVVIKTRDGEHRVPRPDA